MEGKDRINHAMIQGDALLVGFGGFMLTYVVNVAHGYAHPLHWMWAAIGAVLSYLWAWGLLYWRERRRRALWGAKAPEKKQQ